MLGTSIQGPGPMMAAQTPSGQMGGSIGMECGVRGGLSSQSYGGMVMGDQGMVDDSYWNAFINGE
jgi:hypothetical protein